VNYFERAWSLLPFLRATFWQSKINNQPLPLIVNVGAFHKLLGELLQGLSHLLQFLALIEWSRPRHIAAFGGIATEFFDSFNKKLRDPSLVQPKLFTKAKRERGHHHAYRSVMLG
jgi:hypothetical protein